MNEQYLLAIKIGNTSLAFGLYARGDRMRTQAAQEQPSSGQQQSPLHAWRVESQPERTADEYGALLLSLLAKTTVAPDSIRSAAVVSVVPPLTQVMRELCLQYLSVEPFVAEPGVKSGLRIKYDDPRALGADRLVCLVAARTKYGAPAILIDMGTAVTFNALDARGDFVGGAIAPGMSMSAAALHRFTAKLPHVQISAPPQVIATNTQDALRSGIFVGFTEMVEGMVKRFRRELNEPQARVIATGGMAGLVAPHCPAIQRVDPMLALDGLCMLYEMNTR
jgi:type III pantothenate kinase